MKKIITLLLLFSIHSSHAKYFWGASILPQNPSVNDSIILIDTVTLSTSDYRHSYDLSIRGDSVFLKICYVKPGGLQGDQELKERTNLGLFPVGTYKLFISGYIQDNATQVCYNERDSFYNRLQLSFQVRDFTGIEDKFTLPFINLKSNIASDFIGIENKLMQKISLNVLDLTGRLHHSSTIQSSEFSLDVSDWSSGVYIVAVQVGQERKRWRIFKE